MAMLVPTPKALLADKGYDGDSFRENPLFHGILPVIPPKANRNNPPPCDFKRYKDCNRVKRMFGFLKHQRRIATRYDKTALSFASFPNIAAARL
jgi:transposase